MEQKRIKLENPTPPTKSSSASTYDPRQIIDALGLFRSKPQKAQAELLRLKKHLDSKERVLAFLEYDNKSAYRALLSHIIGLADNFFVAPYEVDLARQQIVTILRELCSVVANLCHFSVLACIETCLHFDDLCRVFIQVLQDVNQTEEHLLSTLRCPVLRLIGNLCEVKEAATYVALRARLLDLVASSVARPQPSAGEGAADDDEDKAPLEQRQEQGLNSNDEHYYALRVLRLLATRRKHSNSVVRSNVCAKIATFIVRRQRSGETVFASRPYLLQLLSCLLRFHSMEVGDQIATSSAECVDLFLQFLLDQRSRQQNVKLAHHWTEFIFHCVQTSHKMRYQLGQEAIITVLRYDETTLNDVHCRFLCCFLKDVHGRAWLRESGGLDRILWRLATPDQCGEDLDLLRLQQIVVADLGSVLHDHALLLTINHPNFLPTAIAQINRFLEENSEKCKIVSDRHALNVVTVIPPMSEDFCEVEIVEKSVSRKRKNDEVTDFDLPLCKDFNTFCWPPLQSPAASPPSARRFAWSPSMSPSTSSAAYDQYMSSPSASPPSDNAQFQLDDYLKEGLKTGMSPPLHLLESLKTRVMSPPLHEDLVPEEMEADENKTIDDEAEIDAGEEGTDAAGGPSSTDGKAMVRKKMKKMRGKIVDGFLTLISTFSHSDERQSIVLLSEKVMRALVRHVSEAPAMDHRLGRALRRLARHQMGLQKMLEMDFCQMIIKHLFRRPCLLTRFAKPCIRCAYRRDFGIFLLGDHAILADSSMGEHILLRVRMNDASGAETGRVRALAAALVLLRKDEHRTRFHHNFQPIDALLDAVARLVKEMMCSSDQRQLDEHTEEGQLCCDVLSALSSMLQCHQQIFESVGNGRQLFGPKGKSIQPAESVGSTHCVLEAKNAVAMSDDETLKFLDKNGLSLVAEVPKRELCTYNEYFMGMFGSEFLERLTGRNQFVFDADAECSSQEDFVKFLHFSIGCGLQSECVQVASAECCVALLRLADKYLCTRLLDHLLQSDKASRFITGHTLRLFLPLVLTVPTVGDGGGLTCVCALVLLRYCTDAQALDVLQLLGVRDASQHQYRMAATTPLPALSLVDALCNALGTFVRPFAALTPQRGKKGGLMRDPLLDPSAYWDFR